MAPPHVALVGPIPPWRSGIADQTVRLARAMTRLGVPPLVITFRRMYPKVLFPGAADRGPGDFPEELPEVLPLLDGASVSSFRRAAHVIAARAPALVVLPWWTAFWAPHSLVFLSALARAEPRAVKLLVCHNVFDHEAGPVKRAAARAVFHRADRFAVQNRRAAEELRRALPGKEVAFLPHPSEPREVLPDREGARARLGLPPAAPIFLFTGILRPYKGWDVLLAALPRVIRELPEVLVVFAGEPWGDARRLPETWGRDPHVRLELRYLGDEERAHWIDACDAVVCPYRHATGSGIAADAFAHGRPVIGTRVDGLVDVVEDGDTGLLVPPEEPAALANALIRFAKEKLGPHLSANVVRHRGRFSPETHARGLLLLGGVAV